MRKLTKLLILLSIGVIPLAGCNINKDNKIEVSVKDDTVTIYERTIPVTVKKIHDKYFTALSNEKIIKVYTTQSKLSKLGEGDSISVKKYKKIKDDIVIDYKYTY